VSFCGSRKKKYDSRHRPLAELWEKGRRGKIDAKMQARILPRLDRLDVIERPEEMNVPALISMPCEASNRRTIQSVSMDHGVSRSNSKMVTLVEATSNNITEDGQLWLMSPSVI
jgi:hypothetical protein